MKIYAKFLRYCKDNDFYWIISRYSHLTEFLTFLFYQEGEIVLNQYLTNVLKLRGEEKFGKLIDKTNYIMGAFSWADTKQGFDYWAEINYEWINFYSHHKTL